MTSMETYWQKDNLMKALLVAKVVKVAIKEVKKYNFNATLDKDTSKLVVTIHRKR